jgi:hypothetical protein
VGAEPGETERRLAYERLYAAYRSARRRLHGAAGAGVCDADLRPLRETLTLLHTQLAAWQSGPAHTG